MAKNPKKPGRPTQTIGEIQAIVAAGGVESLTTYEYGIWERTERRRAANVKPVKVLRKRGRPLPVDQRIAKIRHNELCLLEAKQATGEKLTGADHAFLREVIAAEAESRSIFGTRELVQESLEKRLQLARLQVFDVYIDLVRNGKGIARLQAAGALKQWADEECPAVPYKANPLGLRIVTHPEAKQQAVV